MIPQSNQLNIFISCDLNEVVSVSNYDDVVTLVQDNALPEGASKISHAIFSSKELSNVTLHFGNMVMLTNLAKVVDGLCTIHPKSSKEHKNIKTNFEKFGMIPFNKIAPSWTKAFDLHSSTMIVKKHAALIREKGKHSQKARKGY